MKWQFEKCPNIFQDEKKSPELDVVACCWNYYEFIFFSECFLDMHID